MSKRVCPIEPHQMRLKKAPPDVREAADRILEPLNQLEAAGSSNMTLDQFAEHHYWPWLKAEREPGTAYNYKLVYNNHIKNQLGSKRLWEVRIATVSQALAETFRQHPALTKRTLFQHRSIVYSIFNWRSARAMRLRRIQPGETVSYLVARTQGNRRRITTWT